MAMTSTYLTFTNQTEAAFDFYKSAYGTEFVGDGIARMGDAPPQPGMPELSDADKQLVMNVQLPITGGHLLMGSDVPPGMGLTVNQGNNVAICIDPESRAEADRLFAALSAGGTVEMPLAEMFWGDYYGSFVDKFGIHWAINYTGKS